MTRRCYLHVGTHKTGTTSLQDMLGRNAALLEREGTLVPKAGRPATDGGGAFAGHHNLGMELLAHPGFVPADGTLEDFSRELAATSCRRAVVSAESLSFAHHSPGGLARLRDAVTRAGFEPIVVFYFREQAAYARSIYAMKTITYGGTTSFDAFCERIVTYRGFCDGKEAAPFEYDRLLRPFEIAFGKERIVARAFDPRRDSRDFVRDFLAIVHPAPLDEDALQIGDRLNVGGSLEAVMSALHANRCATRPGLAGIDRVAAATGIAAQKLARPFDPVDARLQHRFSSEFRASNRRLRAAYGVEIDDAPVPAPDAHEQYAFVAACEAAWKNAGP
jgi:hypothetical protein